MNDIDRAEPRLAAFLAARVADTAGMPTADDILGRLGGGVVRRDRRFRVGWVAVAVGLLGVALVGGALLGAGGLFERHQGLPPPLDGRTNGWLAYVDGRSIIAITPSGAEAPRTLFTQTPGSWIDSPSWSPDGQKLAYFGGSAGDTNGLLSVIEKGASRHVQSEIGFRATPDAHQIAWAPDSSRVAIPERDGITSDAVGSMPIYAIGGGDVPYWVGPGQVLSAVTWSPDGRRVAFLRTDLGRLQRAIEVISFDDSTGNLVGEHLTLLPGGTELDLSLHGWSPDSRKLLYAARRTNNGTGQHDIESIDVDTGATTVVSNELFDESWPVWSPDGSRIAWQRDPGTGTPEIVVAAADGTGLRVVSTDEDSVADGPMIWSPDGHSIVTSACRGASTCNGSLLILPVDPEGIRKLVPLAPQSAPGPRLNFSWAAK